MGPELAVALDGDPGRGDPGDGVDRGPHDQLQGLLEVFRARGRDNRRAASCNDATSVVVCSVCNKPAALFTLPGCRRLLRHPAGRAWN